MNEKRAALAVCAALALGGCLVGPNFKTPTPPEVDAYLPQEPPAPHPESGADAAQHVALGQRIPAQWWALFHSSRLDETLHQVITDSYTLAAAKTTPAQARGGPVE